MILGSFIVIFPLPLIIYDFYVWSYRDTMVCTMCRAEYLDFEFVNREIHQFLCLRQSSIEVKVLWHKHRYIYLFLHCMIWFLVANIHIFASMIVCVFYIICWYQISFLDSFELWYRLLRIFEKNMIQYFLGITNI